MVSSDNDDDDDDGISSLMSWISPTRIQPLLKERVDHSTRYTGNAWLSAVQMKAAANGFGGKAICCVVELISHW